LAGPVEGDPPVAQRDIGIVADDQVVEQVDVQQPPGRQRLGREVEVVRAWRGIAPNEIGGKTSPGNSPVGPA
jgi:hypothetical protein